MLKALEQLKTMVILDSTITLSHMLEWTKTLTGIKNHSHMPAETMNAYDSEYKKLLCFWIANREHAGQQKWLENQLVELNVDLELATNEALLDIVASLGIEMDVMKVEKIALETQTEEQRTAMYAQKQEERELIIKHKLQNGRPSCITWTAEVDEEITRMIADGYSYPEIASELGNGLKTNDIDKRWNQYLKKTTDIIKPQVQKGKLISINWTAEVGVPHQCNHHPLPPSRTPPTNVPSLGEKFRYPYTYQRQTVR